MTRPAPADLKHVETIARAIIGTGKPDTFTVALGLLAAISAIADHIGEDRDRVMLAQAMMDEALNISAVVGRFPERLDS